MAEATPIKVEIELINNTRAGIHSDTGLVTVPSKAFARLMCDLVEEATRRGMEVGAEMVRDALLEDEPEERTFPGFLGEGNDS